MAPSLVRPPFHRDGFVYEEKVDGWRMLAYKEGPRVRLISRNAVDHTARFRELVSDALHYRGVIEWGFQAADVMALLRHARDLAQRECPFVGAPKERGAA